MNTISSLPKELLFNVFNKLDNLAHLAECRLVCRAWCDPVERAMLGNTITIDSNEAEMRSLYAFLQLDPARAYLIKHLDFSLRVLPISTVIQELSQLALTSNIESMTGFIEDSNFLMDIVEKSPNKFDKLKTLTLSCSEGPPLKLALHCRETIQTMDVSFCGVYNSFDWSFMDRLNEFRHLTSFTLEADVGGIKNLDKILDGCPHLREFVLEEEENFNSINDVKLNLQDIKRHINMRVFWLITSYNFDDMMQYLLYKFIGVEEIVMDLNGDDSFDGFPFHSKQEKWANLKPKEAAVQEILRSLKERADCMAKIEDNFESFRIKIVQK